MVYLRQSADSGAGAFSGKPAPSKDHVPRGLEYIPSGEDAVPVNMHNILQCCAVVVRYACYKYGYVVLVLHSGIVSSILFRVVNDVCSSTVVQYHTVGGEGGTQDSASKCITLRYYISGTKDLVNNIGCAYLS